MGKNVLIIVPPNITYEAFIRPTKNTKSFKHKSGRECGVIITDVPLGPLTLSSWLKEKCDAQVKIIDFNVEIHKNWDHPDEDNFELWFYERLSSPDVAGFEPDIIGFSSLFVTGFKNLLALGRVAKKLFPNAVQIVGGNLATTMYNEIYAEEQACFDALCYGEGELPLLELMAADDPVEYLGKSPSWVTREKIGRNTAFAHNFINDLDEIPYLDYGAIDLRDYHYSPTIEAYTSIGDKANYLTYMTSRGCPFFCTFCSAHTVHGRKMRYFSLDRVREELSHFVEHCTVNTLVIEDDHFLSNKERALGVLEIANELNLVCFFPNALALYGLDREMLEALAANGVRQLTLAVESGSARVLKEVMRKPLRLDITYQVAKDCEELGIYTDCNIILGMPGETMADIEETRAFLKTLSANWFRINVATPLAGSEMYIKAKEKGQIVGDIRMAGYKQCVVRTDDFEPGQIEKIAYEMNLELNFLHNLDVRRGNWQRAIESFENVLSLKEDHALASFMLFKCHAAAGEQETSDAYLRKTAAIYAVDPFWKKFFDARDLQYELADEVLSPQPG